MTSANTASTSASIADRLRVDFLYLDLTTCDRCRGTDRKLAEALEATRELLAAGGTDVELNKIHVTSADEARSLRFESSPTIRVNGRDVALELRESSCGSEACTDGCGDSIACRVWVHRGREYTEPPVEMITEAIRRAIGGDTQPGRIPDPERYELPENLERFFAAKDAAAAEERAASPDRDRADCCSPAEQSTCCEPADKAECCGAGTRGSCGCR